MSVAEKITDHVREAGLHENHENLAARLVDFLSKPDSAEFVDTDIANAARLARRHGTNVRFTAAGGWLIWNGTHWLEDPKGVRIQALAKDTAVAIFDEIKGAIDRDGMMRHAKRSQSRAAIEAMVLLARSEAGLLAEITAFDTDHMLFNVANGTLDLRAGKLRPHRREDLITRMSPIQYEPDADYELWDRFLLRVLGGDQELYRYARRLVGYLLTGNTTEQVLHFLYGLGANGKSVFCEILQDLLGDYAIVVSPELILVRRHGGIPNDIARLRGVRAAFMNETSQGSRFDESKLKDLTGGDTLTGRFLHQEFFDFPPTHKIVIRGNHKPVIAGTDDGIWRRLRLVPFLVSIPPEEQDHQLIDKLRGELPGILRWAVEGCLEWQLEGLKPPAVILDAVREYREESDTLGRFIGEHCDARKLAQVKSGIFFQRYQQFAETAGERWIPHKDLPQEMRRRGFEYKRAKDGGLYLGIELTTESDSWQR
jgi:putative DNA primase/helicase